MSSYLPAKQTTSFKEIGWVRSLQIHNSFLFKPNYFWIFTITCFNNFSIFWGSKWCIHNSSTPPFSTLFSLVMQTVTKISWYRRNNYLYSNIKPWLHGAYRMQIGRRRCLRKASFCLQFYCWLQCSCSAKNIYKSIIKHQCVLHQSFYNFFILQAQTSLPIVSSKTQSFLWKSAVSFLGIPHCQQQPTFISNSNPTAGSIPVNNSGSNAENRA